MRVLPPNLRLLATTATANDRVMCDLGAVLGPGLEVSHGDLNRPSLLLQTIHLPSQAERLAWLAQHVPEMPGSGIVYTLTVRDAVQVAEWLRSRDVDVQSYTSRTGERREELEQALFGNRVKALVATTALGMGYDKPDLGFVVHYQSPGSVVAYYQQVARAGRALDAAYGVLLSGDEELEITDYFIQTAFPTRDEVDAVLAALHAEPEGLSVPSLLRQVNLSKGRIEKTLALLSLDGDPAGAVEPNLPRLPAGPDPELVRAAVAFLRRTSLPLEPRARWPQGGLEVYGLKGTIPPERRAELGKALCIWSDAGWGRQVREGKYRDGHFGDDLVSACADLVSAWSPQPSPRWVTCIPSHRLLR